MHVIIFGDSIAQGFFDTKQNGWATRLSVLLQNQTVDSNFQQYHSVFNQSISGETTTKIVSRMQSEISARLSSQKENILIFAGGINDAAHRGEVDNNLVPISEARANIELFIANAKKVADHICVLGLTAIEESHLNPYPMSTTDKCWSNKNVAAYDQMIQQVAEDASVVHIPMFDLLSPEHLADGLHPNVAGHQLMYERIKETFEAEGIL